MKNFEIYENEMLNKMEEKAETALRMVTALLDNGMKIFGDVDEAIEYAKRTMYIKSLAIDIENPWSNQDMRDYLSHYYE